MPNYDATWFNPPGPLAQVKLRNPRSNIGLSDVPMLLDSGADVTILPDATAVALGLDMIADRRYELIGFGGGIVLARAVQAELSFCRRTFRGRFLLVEQEWGIIGRNVLNAVPLLFDGPHLTWNEHGA